MNLMRGLLKSQKFLPCIVLILCLAMVFSLIDFLNPAMSFAEFNVSVRPYEGGSDIRFGRIKTFGPPTSRELIVTMNSDLGKQYELVQTLLEPLTNDQGGTLSSQNLVVYAVVGSNRQGTVSAQIEVPVTMAKTVLYTSSPQGLSDSLNLVYVLKGGAQLPSGSYRGRIAFSLEPFASSEPPVTVILNLFAEIEAEAGVEIKTITGSKTISLSTSRDDRKEGVCFVEIKGQMSAPYKITQQLQDLLRSPEGDILPEGSVTFQVSEAKKGSGTAQPTALSQRPELVYTSNSGGDADAFVLTYLLKEPKDQRAGVYRTNLVSLFESGPERNPLDPLTLEVDIARKFDLIITPEIGGTIEFRDLKVQEPPKRSEVTIEVNSNIGRPYQVTQQMVSGLVNKEGKAIPAKQFTQKEESLETKGMLPFLAAPAEVKTGEVLIFASDKEGSSDRFKIIYELTPSYDIQAGDYSARVMYSISEI